MPMKGQVSETDSKMGAAVKSKVKNKMKGLRIEIPQILLDDRGMSLHLLSLQMRGVSIVKKNKNTEA